MLRFSSPVIALTVMLAGLPSAWAGRHGADTGVSGTTTDKMKDPKSAKPEPLSLHQPAQSKAAPSCLRERPDNRGHRPDHRLRRRHRPRKHSWHHRYQPTTRLNADQHNGSFNKQYRFGL